MTELDRLREALPPQKKFSAGECEQFTGTLGRELVRYMQLYARDYALTAVQAALIDQALTDLVANTQEIEAALASPSDPVDGALSDEEIVNIRDSLLPSQGDQFDCVAFARAIESRLLTPALASPPVEPVEPGEAMRWIPVGWKLVPVKPNDDMQSVGAQHLMTSTDRGARSWAEEAKLTYLAMLAAAPEPEGDVTNE